MNDDVYDSDRPASRLYGLFTLLLYISLALCGLTLACCFLNVLDNFLHAPIGIKDNPPEPGAIVQLAQLLCVPFGLSCLLFWFLSLMSRVFKSVPLLLGTLMVVCGLLSLVGGLLGQYNNGHQFFSGQLFFTQTVTPVMWATFITSWVGVGAYRCFTRWGIERKVRYLACGILVTLGILFAVVGGVSSLAVRSDVITDTGFMLVASGSLMAILGYIVYIAPGKW